MGKKSRKNNEKKFLVPLGFSSFEPFAVQRGEVDENRLEIHLRTEKAKFYVLIDDVKAMREWMHSQLNLAKDNNENENEADRDEGVAVPPSQSSRSRIACCFWFLVPILLAISMAAMVLTVDEVHSRLVEFQDRHHQHQFEHDEIVTLYGELDAITTYCQHYTDEVRAETEGDGTALDEFCSAILTAHDTCPVDVLFL